MIENAEKFLVDANSFITPYKNYYPFDLAPSFWSQLVLSKNRESIYLLDLVNNEITKGDDELSNWVNQNSNFNIVRIDEEIVNNYSRVINYIAQSGYYNQNALNNWSNEAVADPWLIAAALKDKYTIITLEKPTGNLNKNTPSKNPKIPDVAKHFNVKYENLFYMMRSLNFRL